MGSSNALKYKMEKATLRKLIAANDASALRRAFITEHNSKFDPIDFLNYDPSTHKIITDRIFRQDKIVYYEVPNQYDVTGKPMTEFRVVPVTRLALSYQQEIVDTTVSFSVGGKIGIKSTPKTDDEKLLHSEVEDIWRYNKMQFRIKDIARKMYSETECAFLLYADKDDDGDVVFKNRIVSPSDGDILYPSYDGKGDMTAFAFEYMTSSYVFCFDVYTSEFLYKYADIDGMFRLIRTIRLDYGKIPVIYFNQSESEWKKVQTLIERFELSFSNLCDTNDYNGSPIMFTQGEIEGFADKGERGKLLIGKDGADIKYLTWDKAPESIKLELETLRKEIYTKTRTVDLSPEAIKGMGTAPSGVAFDRMMISPHMKAQDKQDGSLGEGIYRILNLFKSCVINFIEPRLKKVKNLYIEPEFSLFRIDDLQDRIETVAMAAPGQQTMSLSTIVKYLNATSDHEAEVTAIEADTQRLNEVSNPFSGGGTGGAA